PTPMQPEWAKRDWPWLYTTGAQYRPRFSQLTSEAVFGGYRQVARVAIFPIAPDRRVVGLVEDVVQVRLEAEVVGRLIGAEEMQQRIAALLRITASRPLVLGAD